MSNHTAPNIVPSDSSSDIDSDIIESRLYQNESVPLDLRSVADDAILERLSRANSKHSEKVIDENNVRKVTSSSSEKYDRFSIHQRYGSVAIASAACFLSPLSSLALLPAIPEIASRFNTDTEIINVSNAVYCVFMSLSPCFFSPISDIYGRRITFLTCCVLFSVTTILVAVSQNLAMFFVFRLLTAFFGTSFFSIGGHIVGDMFPPSQRGRCISYIIMGSQVGSGFGPVIGGVIVNYTSWRVIFWVMAGLGVVSSVLGFVLLPETAVETGHSLILEEARKTNPKKKFVFVAFNPLRVMMALKYPNLFIDGLITIFIIYNMFNLLTPIRSVVDPRFNLSKPVYSGLFYLPPGMGYLVGSFFGGKWADITVKRYIKKRGRRVPEDRLRTVIIPLGIMYPISMLIYGWSIDQKKGGMPLPIVMMFIAGLAQTCSFPAINTYCVDSMPELKGDGIASSYFSRYIAAAVASATCLKSIDSIGVGWTCTIGSFVLWLGMLCALILIKYGEQIRIKYLIKYGLRKE